MILNKALLIKGLVGTASALGIGTGAYFGRDHISELFRTNKGNNASGPQVDQQQEISEAELIKKVGLDCNTPSAQGTDCSKLTEEGAEKISVKREESDGKFEIDTITGGKIKLYKLENGNNTDNYHKGLKFVIEDGDITKDNKKLEQFETYEIEKDTTDNKYYLKRKFTKPQAIKKALGLPDSCDLTDNGTCSEVTVDSSNIGQIKFDGANSSDTPTLSTSAKLTVTKENASDPYFPLGYKFIFKAQNSDATLNIGSKSITIKTNTGTEFRIKKPDTGNNITLEEAWTKDNITKIVNLNCGSDDTCTQISGQTTNIKQENELENKTIPASGSGSGKIKVYTGAESEGYNKGFKFVIEDGDITIDSSNNTKLEQFETYEIKKGENGDSGKYYLTRKNKAIEEKKKLLGLPEDCTLPTSDSDSSCSEKEIDADKLKKINFEGKNSSGTPTIGDSKKVTLTITKTSDSPFTDGGYKFKFTSEGEISIPKTDGGNITIKANTNTEFKIKKTENKLTLEKAWTAKTLGEKVGLNCPDPSTDSSEKKCSFTDGSINVNNGSDDKISKAKVKNSGDDSSKKMTYEEDQEGYNQGFKFFLDESEDLSLANGTEGSADTSGDKKICKKGASGSEAYYEIKEESGTWYLTKKTTTGGSGQ